MFPEEKYKNMAQKLKFSESFEKAFLDNYKHNSASLLKYLSIILLIVLVIYIIIDIFLGNFKAAIFWRLFSLIITIYSLYLSIKPDAMPNQNRQLWAAQAILFFSIAHSIVLSMSYKIPNAAYMYFTAYPFVFIGSAIFLRKIYFYLVSGIAAFVYLLSTFFSGAFQLEHNIHFHSQNITIVILILLGIIINYLLEFLYRSKFITEVKSDNTEIKQEYVLHKILPESIASKIEKELGKVSNAFETTTVMFAEITGFSQLSQNMPQTVLTTFLTEFEEHFNLLAKKHNIEYIKTEGDYGPFWIVTGLPEYRFEHAESMIEMALDMKEIVIRSEKRTNHFFKIRIGVHSGPVVACWIGGEGLYIYDLYGNTIKIAKQLEYHGVTGGIQVSESTYNLLKKKYVFNYRTEISIDTKTTMKAYMLQQRL